MNLSVFDRSYRFYKTFSSYFIINNEIGYHSGRWHISILSVLSHHNHLYIWICSYVVSSFESSSVGLYLSTHWSQFFYIELDLVYLLVLILLHWVGFGEWSMFLPEFYTVLESTVWFSICTKSFLYLLVEVLGPYFSIIWIVTLVLVIYFCNYSSRIVLIFTKETVSSTTFLLFSSMFKTLL